ncbi:hypothetical protein [Haloarcula salinisoli]|uniref:Uncharacterized protein n=1 Tax=Haloarcula salinisoli TaxID=2487746 RepID=A0A8J8C690_9EURY|nr:hypothetical protein [Halomicroarcula salinisoli]MBX0286460.1 hypothetical protein [Halomicroarcula salinisoli]MBX0302051.1 hypothetical protein [Halomicroarcula salinisoli]
MRCLSAGRSAGGGALRRRRKGGSLDDGKLIRPEQDDVTLPAHIADSGEEFGLDMDIDVLRAVLPTDWKRERHPDTCRLFEGQLQALGYR